MAFRQISDLKKSHRHAHTLRDSLKQNAFHFEFQNGAGKGKENDIGWEGNSRWWSYKCTARGMYYHLVFLITSVHGSFSLSTSGIVSLFQGADLGIQSQRPGWPIQHPLWLLDYNSYHPRPLAMARVRADESCYLIPYGGITLAAPITGTHFLTGWLLSHTSWSLQLVHADWDWWDLDSNNSCKFSSSALGIEAWERERCATWYSILS